MEHIIRGLRQRIFIKV